MNTPRTGVRVSDQDPEMLAIKAVLVALAPLDEQAAARVLGWAEARYGVEAQRLAVDRLSTCLSDSLKVTFQGIEAVSAASRAIGMDEKALQRALVRLAAEVEAS